MGNWHNYHDLDSFHDWADRFVWSGFTGNPWRTNDRLNQKVDAQGKLKPYFGNTVVFNLPQPVRQALKGVQDQLYAACGDALAEPLTEDVLHITLHDLCNGADTYRLRQEMARTGEQMAALCRALAEKNEEIRMRATGLFNLEGVSVVQGFAAADEESFDRLMACYDEVDAAYPLSYDLLPHVTLAYYKPGLMTADRLAALDAVAKAVNAVAPQTLTLNTGMLTYLTFTDMNHYQE